MDTLYLQADNCVTNKCWAVIAGLAALVLLGVVRKVTLSFMIQFHTHRDESAVMGTVSGVFGRQHRFAVVLLIDHNNRIMTYTDYRTFMTYDAWRSALLNSIAQGYANEFGGKHVDSTVLGVDLLLHFPDYAKMFIGINNCNIQGIARAHTLRLAMNEEGDAIQLHYKEDVRILGWYHYHKIIARIFTLIVKHYIY